MSVELLRVQSVGTLIAIYFIPLMKFKDDKIKGWNVGSLSQNLLLHKSEIKPPSTNFILLKCCFVSDYTLRC